MNSKRTNQSGLFLIELIISIFFFIVIAVVCTQLFIHAKTLSDKTINLNHSIMWLENVSEVFLSENGNFDSTKLFFSNQISSESKDLVIYFDSDWSVTKSNEIAKYKLTASNEISEADSGYFSYLLIDVSSINSNSNEELYSANIKKFVAKGGNYGTK